MNYPGITFFNSSLTVPITSKASLLPHLKNLGIYLSIPEDSLGPEDEPLDLLICPCFCGQFELPRGYSSASPAYLIQPSRRVAFQKDVIVRLKHYASLQNTKECKAMEFLSASSTPTIRDSGPVYKFRKMKGTQGTFQPRDQVGEILLRHFCILKIASNKGEEDSTDKSKSKGEH